MLRPRPGGGGRGLGEVTAKGHGFFSEVTNITRNWLRVCENTRHHWTAHLKMDISCGMTLISIRLLKFF